VTKYARAKPAGTPTWVDILTPDIDRARQFYHAVFGWEYDISGPEFGGYTTARLGKHPVAGLTPPMPGAPATPAAWSLYFATENAAADQAQAAKLGAQTLFPAMAVGDFGSMALSVDPGGAAFGFWQAGNHIGFEVTEEAGSPAWFELYASDAKQARDFYKQLLNLDADPMPGGMEYYVLKRGEDQLAGIMQIERSWGDFRPQWMTYFAVANADETVATVQKNGGRAMSKVDDSPFGRLAAVADPHGALFKIIEPPKG
jgi:uncharacterized protein